MQSLVYTVAIGLAAIAASTALSAQERPEPATGANPTAADTSPLVHEVDIDAPVEDVWSVFSTPEGLKLLGVAQAEVDFRVGGTMRTHYDPKGVLGDENTIEQAIIAFEPVRMIAFRITKPPQGFPFTEAYKAMWSVASMTDLGGSRTHLRLAQMGYTPDPESQQMRAFFDQGNAWVLDKLKKNLEGGSAAAGKDEVGNAEGKEREAGRRTDASAARDGGPTAGDEQGLSPIRKEAVIRAPVAEVWKCWTTGAGIESFLTEAKVDLRIGGPFEVYFGPDAPLGQRGSEGCTVLSYEPQRMLSFSWNAPPKFGDLREEHTWVVLHFDPEGPHSCRVSLDHLGFAERAGEDPGRSEDWARVREYFDTAWPSVLAALQKHFEPGNVIPATTNG